MERACLRRAGIFPQMRTNGFTNGTNDGTRMKRKTSLINAEYLCLFVFYLRPFVDDFYPRITRICTEVSTNEHKWFHKWSQIIYPRITRIITEVSTNAHKWFHKWAQMDGTRMTRKTSLINAEYLCSFVLYLRPFVDDFTTDSHGGIHK